MGVMVSTEDFLFSKEVSNWIATYSPHHKFILFSKNFSMITAHEWKISSSTFPSWNDHPGKASPVCIAGIGGLKTLAGKLFSYTLW